jgi:hypothetical protein
MSVKIANEFKPCLYEGAGFAFCFGNFGDVFYLIFEEFFS